MVTSYPVAHGYQRSMETESKCGKPISGPIQTLNILKVLPPFSNTSPKLSSGSGPDMSSPSASRFNNSGEPSTDILIGRDAVGTPVAPHAATEHAP